MTDFVALKAAVDNHLSQATYWKATSKLGKGYAVAYSFEALALRAYVDALAAGQSPAPPLPQTEHGKGLLGIIQAGVTAAPTPTPTPSPAPVGVPRQGITVPLGNLTAAVMDNIKTVSAGKPMFLRTDFWPGNAQFAAAKALADARGLTVMGLYTEPWPTRSSSAAFAYACAVAAKALTWVNVHNEPDNPWRDSGGAWDAAVAGQYAAAAYDAVKKANLNSQVVGPSVSMNLGVDEELAWLDAFFTAGGKVDYPSLHLYGAAQDTGWATNPWKRYNEFKALFVKHLGAQAADRVIVTECGFNTTATATRTYAQAVDYQTQAVANALGARGTLGILSTLVYSMTDTAEPGGFGIYGRPAFAEMKARAL